MTMDPREAKLPKWAQEALAAERRRASLAWPTEPRPEPVWQPGANTYADTNFDGQTLWGANPHRPAPEEVEVRDRHVYPAGSKNGHGSRPEHGRYFRTAREAWVDMWWARAEAAADRLYAAQQGAQHAEET